MSEYITRDVLKPYSDTCVTLLVSSPVQRMDRESVLDVCVSQQLVSVLTDCVVEFSDGKFASAGCTLETLLSWAWQRVTHLKQDSDQLLGTLFSGRNETQLTPAQLQRLHHNLTKLGTLRTMLSLCAQHTPTAHG